MAKRAIEIILARQLAGYFSLPCFVFDSQGTLSFYNEPAETILGQRFEETGEMLVGDLARIFTPTDGKGRPLRTDAHPLGVVFLTHRPTYKRFWIRGLDGVRRQVDSSAFPLIGAGEQFLGAMAIFPEVAAEKAAAARGEGQHHPLRAYPALRTPALAASGEVHSRIQEDPATRPPKEIEVILTRHLASYLATPIFLVDPQATLLYFNEPAERIVGQRFEEAGEMRAEEYLTVFDPTDQAGNPLPHGARAMMLVLTEHRPAHNSLWIRSRDGVRRQIEQVAVPIIGQAERFLGGMSLFWEVEA